MVGEETCSQLLLQKFSSYVENMKEFTVKEKGKKDKPDDSAVIRKFQQGLWGVLEPKSLVTRLPYFTGMGLH